MALTVHDTLGSSTPTILVGAGSTPPTGRQRAVHHLLGTVPGRHRRRLGGSLPERAGWLLAGTWTMFVAVQVWDGSLVVPWVLATALIGVAAGLATLVRVATGRGLSAGTQLALLGILALLTFARAYVAVVHTPAYGTDEIAFDQYAAQLLLHGHDPYGHSMAPAFALFQVPDVYRTWTLSGGYISSLSYPAGSFLFYIPALLLGIHMQAAVLTDVVFWVAGIVTLWAVLPRPVRFVPALLLGAHVLFGFAVGGVSDVLYLPFAVVALARWDRFSVQAGGRWQRWSGPVCLGIAASVKQTPWFWIPFVLVGIALEARAHGRRPLAEASRYAAALVATFAAINGPFLIASPRDFLAGMLAPLLSKTVPGGQGIIGWAMFTSHGGLLDLYTIAALAVALCALLWYVATWPSSKPALVAIVAGVFFFPSRSFDEYFLEIAPLVFAVALTVSDSWTSHRQPFAPPRSNRTVPAALRPSARRLWHVAAMISLGVAGFAAGAAVLVRPPISIAVAKIHSTGQLDTVDRLRVSVFNHSHGTVTPHYATDQTGQQSAFWLLVAGPRHLRPGERASVTLQAPNVASMPSLFSPFVLNAFLARPAAVATSTEVSAQRYQTLLTPLGVDRAVPVGQAVDMRAQLTNTIGAPVELAGVHIDLGQVVYGQTSLGYGEASINGAPEGDTPVTATTDAMGRATFVVRGIQAESDPIFFQAWVVPPDGLPMSYSDMVDIQFVARRQTIHHRTSRVPARTR